MLSFIIRHQMPTIRDLVSAVRQREGVAAAVVLGRDGLLIDGQATAGIDTEGLAAVVPAVLTSSEELGGHAGGITLNTCVLEYEEQIIIICSLTADAILLVVANENADIARLLFELRRNRRRIAAII
ncbi:MAG: roadblock/LC7 domain-containing protein [Gemmatimonadaceae bacterium]|nr:roadblock/LC7 domain-containing protein [Gemmatimonadaceae bacterium]MDQ3517066.1 roadblock/LC7 domain-containing protein [Gemmatimonadota bacterium]